jgi:glycolate oxidase FAD binding subunit
MSERAARELERTFGRANVSFARLAPEAAEIPLLAPATAEGICEALALAQREHFVVVPTGHGSKLSWTKAPSRVDFLLSTRAHAGVVAYEPGDGTLTARAGSTMADLALRVAAGGHTLTPDVPRPASATLGGVIGAAQSGSDRLRYGPVRDHVLGVQVALGDGTLAKSGGRLVKNVTGYDLQRLFTGSHGSLCVILEASMRLFALPEEEVLFSAVAADRKEMLRLCALALEAPLRPISLCAARIDPPQPQGEWLVALRLGGRREVVADERATLSSLWPACQVVDGAQARNEAELLRDRQFDAVEGPLLRIELRPSAFAKTLELVEGALRSKEGAALFHPRWWCEPGIALIDVSMRPAKHDALDLSQALSALRTALAASGARVRWLNTPAGLPGEPLAAAPGALALMHRLREQLDPQGVFASGRFLEAR